MRDRIKGFRRIPAAAIEPHPENWRRHPGRQRAILADVLEEVGIADAVIVRELKGGRYQLVDGHLRRELLEGRKVPALVLDVNEDEARKLLLSLDPLAQLADTATDALRALVEKVRPETPGLEQLLAKLAAQGGAVEPIPAGGAEAKIRARAQTGDLWALGDHRLLCGDATSAEDLERLMAGQAAALVFTDPPYGVDYTPKAKGRRKIAGDALQRDALATLLTSALGLAMVHARDDAAFYIWHASATRETFAWSLKAVGLEEHQYLIWAKPTPVLGQADYQWAHEPCFYASKMGRRPAWYGGRNQATVWRLQTGTSDVRAVTLGPGVLLSDGRGREVFVGRPPKRRLRHYRLEAGEVLSLVDGEGTVWEVGRDAGAAHPTQKPVELAARAIANSSRQGEVVLDPFAGSGSTVLAAEAAGRRCYAVEIDRAYCDVIVARWEQLTGDKAVRERPPRGKGGRA